MKWLIKTLLGCIPSVKWSVLALRAIKITIKTIQLFIMENGVLTNKEERWVARVIDRAKKFKNPVLEALDFYLIRILIKIIDDILIEKTIPESWENPVRKLIDMGKAGDVEGIKTMVVEKANEKIDLPFIDEPAEEAIFRNALGFLTAYMYQALAWLKENGEDIGENDD